jgi:hypothetical protein
VVGPGFRVRVHSKTRGKTWDEKKTVVRQDNDEQFLPSNHMIFDTAQVRYVINIMTKIVYLKFVLSKARPYKTRHFKIRNDAHFKTR